MQAKFHITSLEDGFARELNYYRVKDLEGRYFRNKHMSG